MKEFRFLSTNDMEECMGLNDAVKAERVHIGFFGLRNAGKSSVVNAVTGQNMALVSEVKGTTTDPVEKTMELLPLGPVVIIDTPGIDDEGTLGALRVERTKDILRRTDIAVLIVDACKGLDSYDEELISQFKSKDIPYIIAYNKSDLLEEVPISKNNEMCISAKKQLNINELKELIAKVLKSDKKERPLISDIIDAGDLVLLVVPIDSAAPKGRLILPQQQTIRAVLECGASVIVTRETELSQTLSMLSQKPRLVITDSQVFEKVSAVIPEDIELTSFSILFARYKGDLDITVSGAANLDSLKSGDTVLISEGCTHHRQCEDIGTVKIPAWIRKYTGKDINFEFTSGMEFPKELSKYALIIHCGGCMLNEKEMKYRLNHALEQNVSITNYGIAIAKMNGILERSLVPFVKK